MERRSILKNMAVAMAGTVVAAAGNRQAAAEQNAPGKFANPDVGGKLLVNAPRVHALLEEHGLDGLIALNPINVYYLTNMPVTTRFRADYPSFATFARDLGQPNFLVTSAAQARDLSNGTHEMPELLTFAGAGNWRDHVDPLSIKNAGTASDHYEHTAATTPAMALAKALQQSGLTKSKIAVDDMRVAHLLQRAGLTEVTCVLGENLFRMIRAVKTEPELALMRVAAHNNAIATMNTIKAIVPGMTAEEIEHRFEAECAARGNTKTEFLAGVTRAIFPEGKVVAGKPFVIDAVSRFNHYNGDFGRTVIVGDPSRDVIARDRAHMAGREAVLNAIKPGVKFSTLCRVAKQAQVKAGMPEHMIVVNPHTVGLEHGDNPSRLDVPFNVPEDLKLEENMVITVDLPYIEHGWGAGHHEDLLRVTKTGYEALHEEGQALVVI